MARVIGVRFRDNGKIYYFASEQFEVEVGQNVIVETAMFKKAFWVPYEDSANYPTLAKTMEAISKYCEENGKSYTFINDDEVEINGKRYEIYRGYENGSRGNYGIKCKEK